MGATRMIAEDAEQNWMSLKKYWSGEHADDYKAAYYVPYIENIGDFESECDKMNVMCADVMKEFDIIEQSI